MTDARSGDRPKHTAGPWRHRNGIGQYLHEVVATSPRGKDVVVARVSGRDPFREGNAHLIAAAPELLEELSRLVLLLEPLEESGALNVPGLNGARTALHHARGQESPQDRVEPK